MNYTLLTARIFLYMQMYYNLFIIQVFLLIYFFLYLNMTDEQIKEIEDRLEQLEKEQANLELDIDTIIKRLSCN